MHKFALSYPIDMYSIHAYIHSYICTFTISFFFVSLKYKRILYILVLLNSESKHLELVMQLFRWVKGRTSSLTTEFCARMYQDLIEHILLQGKFFQT